MIDSHLHIGLNSWDEKKLLNYLDSFGIDKAWVLTWDEVNPAVPMYYKALDIELVRKVYKNHPDRIVPFYAPDPGRPDWKHKIDTCLDEGFSGCGELKVSYKWNDPRMESLLEYLDEKGLVLIFHMERPRKIFIPENDRGFDWFFKRLINERTNGKGAKWTELLTNNTGIFRKYLNRKQVEFPGYLMNLDLLDHALSTYPNIHFVAHGPDFWNHFRIIQNDDLFHQKGKGKGKGISWHLLDKHNNLFCDISGYSAYSALNKDWKTSAAFLKQFHSKVLYGTDNMELGLFDLIKNLRLGTDVENHIFDGNARRLMK